MLGYLYCAYLVGTSIFVAATPTPPYAVVAAFLAPLVTYFSGRALVDACKRRAPGIGPDSGRWLMVGAKRRIWIRRVVKCLLLLSWIINAADVTFSLNAHSEGVLIELNPVVAWWIYDRTELAPAFKYGMLAFASGIIIRASKRWSALVGAVLVFILSTLLACHWLRFFYIANP